MNKQPINTAQTATIIIPFPVEIRRTAGLTGRGLCEDNKRLWKGEIQMEFGELSITIDSGWIFENMSEGDKWLKAIAEQITVKYGDQPLFEGEGIGNEDSEG